MNLLSNFLSQEAQAQLRVDLLKKKIETTQKSVLEGKWPDRCLHSDDLKPLPFHTAQNIAWDSATRMIVVAAGSQGGKALSVDTLIPTPLGFVAMGDLQVGNCVFGPDGIATTILYVSEVWTDHVCYLVKFDDGSEIIADAEHIWHVQDARRRKNDARRVKNRIVTYSTKNNTPSITGYVDITTEEMARFVTKKNGASNWSIDVASPVEIIKTELPIDPYTFGVWLGDGHSRDPIITSDDKQIIDRIEATGEIVTCLGHMNSGKAYEYKLGTVKIKNGKHYNTMSAKLKDIGVYGNKHIPKQYLFSDKQSRTDLLAGLLDTDGYCNDKGQAEFYSTNEKLFYDVVALACSLGMKVRTRSKIARIYGKDCGLVYTATMASDKSMFCLDRKRASHKVPAKMNTKRRYIVDIKKIDPVPVRCIAVDHPSNCYLASESYITTHNTGWGPHWLLREVYHEKGPGDYLAVTSSFDMFKLKMLPSMLAVFETIYGIGRYWGGDRVIELADPSGKFLANRATDKMWGRIILRSADALGGLESATAKAAWLDECVAPETMIRVLDRDGKAKNVCIQDIVNNKLEILALSYSHKHNIWEWKEIKRWIKIPQTKEFVRIGNLRITPDHKVWTKSGYIESSEIVFERNERKHEILSENPYKYTSVNPDGCSENGGLSSDGFVYNIEVDGNHNYLANEILVANCGQDRFDFSAYKAIRRRVALTQGRMLFTTTLYNIGWFTQKVIDPAVADGETQYIDEGGAEIEITRSPKQDTTVIQFDSIINPMFPKAEYEEQRRLLPDEEFQMFYRGRKASRRFLIYASFDPNKHICHPFPIPESWKRYMGVDFGGSHTAAVYYAEEPGTGTLYAYREYLGGNKSIEQHVQELLRYESGVPIAYGGSRSEDQWRLEFGKAGLPIQPPLTDDVNMGINRVYALHSANSVIYFDNLSGILDEKGRYRRKRDKEGNILDEIESKNTFHRCLVGNTLVSMGDRSQKRISEIAVGDMVQTRSGPKEVTYVFDPRMESVMTLYASNGSHITGTRDHPVFITGQGFVDMDAIRYGIIRTRKDSNKCQKKSCLTELHITDIQSQRDNPMQDISRGKAKFSIEKYGKSIMDLFRMDTIFTMRISTIQIMISKIFYWFQKNITEALFTQDKNQKREYNTLMKYGILHRNGMDQKKDENGTLLMQKRILRKEFQDNLYAKIAERRIVQNQSERMISSAQMHVSQAQEESQELMMLPGSAYAGKNLLVTNMQTEDTAPVYVTKMKNCRNKELVYNFTVRDSHEYYANGILVSNCDAERYLLATIRPGVGMRMKVINLGDTKV